MGNHQQHEQLSKKVNELQIIKKTSHYVALKDCTNKKQYIKFLFASSNDNKQYHELIPYKTNSIFNIKYLQYRYQNQNQSQTSGKKQYMMHLPRILAFGQENQSNLLTSCTSNNSSKLNFVIFQHPLKTLKDEIQERILSGNQFQQIQLIAMIKDILIALSEFYFHIQSWNEDILQRKNFSLNDENIFVDNAGKFIVSDIFMSNNLNQLQSIAKNQVTLKRTSRSVSLTNLHSKTSSRKIKQKFFQNNILNLVAIVEGIIFKFQCFSQSQNNKNSLYQSQSMSTALESYRGLTKTQLNGSIDLDMLIKQLQKTPLDQNSILQKIHEINFGIEKQQAGPQRQQKQNQQVKRSKQQCVQKQQTKKNYSSIDQIKLNASNYYTNLKNQTIRKNALSFNINNEIIHESKIQKNIFLPIANSKSSQSSILNTRTTRNDIHSQRINHKSSTKIRLSLKKNLPSMKNEDEIENKQNIVEQSKKLKRKSSHPKYLCIKTLNCPQNTQGKSKVQFKKNNVSLNQSDHTVLKIFNSHQAIFQKQLNNKLETKSVQNQQEISHSHKKKVFLKKPSNAKQIECRHASNALSLSTVLNDNYVHLNPISRKKNLGFSKHREGNLKQKQNGYNFKTVEKGFSNEGQFEFIQNLSSIISNHNNTLSSYGNPLTEQFKTQSSQIQEEGCIRTNQMDDPSNLSKQKQKNIITSQFLKKNNHSLSPPCVKMSSYPSIQLVESIIQRNQQKIPQFLKQFNLPSKHLLNLNKIILKQKDMIVEQSLQQSELNSFRQSIPNIMGLEDQITEDVMKKRSNKQIEMNYFEQIRKKQKNQVDINLIQDISEIFAEHKLSQQQKQSILYEKSSDSITHGLKQFQFSLMTNSIQNN